MSTEHYEHLDEEQRSRAASLEVAAEHTAGVVAQLDHVSMSGAIKDAPKGGLRSVWGQLVNGEPPKASTDFTVSSFSTFADVTMRFAQWIEFGHEPELFEDDEDEEVES